MIYYQYITINNHAYSLDVKKTIQKKCIHNIFVNIVFFFCILCQVSFDDA